MSFSNAQKTFLATLSEADQAAIRDMDLSAAKEILKGMMGAVAVEAKTNPPPSKRKTSFVLLSSWNITANHNGCLVCGNDECGTPCNSYLYSSADADADAAPLSCDTCRQDMAPSTLYHALRVEGSPSKYHHVRVSECKGKTVNGGPCGLCNNTFDSLVDLHRPDEEKTDKNIICETCFGKSRAAKLRSCQAGAIDKRSSNHFHTPEKKSKKKSQSGLTEEAKDKLNARRRATNERVAATDVGRASVYQHDAVKRIAEEYGLNRKQRLAFFIFGNAWMARNGSPNPDALRLHVSGGAGSGKSYVLAAIDSLVHCPALKGVVEPGGLLTVAFQGKQAAGVGGSTVHSVCDIGTRKKGTMDNTVGQSGLSAKKTGRWAQVGDGAVCMEEISMIGCNLLGKTHEAAVSVRPSGAGLPLAGLICVTFGDLNQLEPVGAKSVSYGAADSTRLNDLTNTERVGRANFMAANASVVLDETNNRFSSSYAPIMDRLLHGECTLDDLAKINARVLGSPAHLHNGSLGMTDCWMAQTITFRNKGETIGTLLLHMKQPVDGLMDERAPYVALSRATALENLYMVEPITIDQLRHKPKEDIAATLDFLDRLDKATQAAFIANPSVFTPVTVSSADGYGRRHRGRTGDDETGTPDFGNGANGPGSTAGEGSRSTAWSAHEDMATPAPAPPSGDDPLPPLPQPKVLTEVMPAAAWACLPREHQQDIINKQGEIFVKAHHMSSVAFVDRVDRGVQVADTEYEQAFTAAEASEAKAKEAAEALQRKAAEHATVAEELERLQQEAALTTETARRDRNIAADKAQRRDQVREHGAEQKRAVVGKDSPGVDQQTIQNIQQTANYVAGALQVQPGSSATMADVMEMIKGQPQDNPFSQHCLHLRSLLRQLFQYTNPIRGQEEDDDDDAEIDENASLQDADISPGSEHDEPEDLRHEYRAWYQRSEDENNMEVERDQETAQRLDGELTSSRPTGTATAAATPTVPQGLVDATAAEQALDAERTRRKADATAAQQALGAERTRRQADLAAAEQALAAEREKREHAEDAA
eukprot:g11338.t1